jgi:hypothetical protein
MTMNKLRRRRTFVFMSRRGDAAWKIPFCNLLGAAMINHEATEEFFPKMRVIYTYPGISSQALLRKYLQGWKS